MLQPIGLGRSALLLLALALASVCCSAAGTDPGTAASSFAGSARAGIWGRSRTLDPQQYGGVANGSLWANGTLDLSWAGAITGDGTVSGQGSAGAITDATVGGQSGKRPNDYRDDRLRELYWYKRVGDLDVKLGRQMIVWGRADAINPTDNLTPRDFTLLTPDDSDQRFGNFATNLVYHLGGYDLQAIWLPEFQTNVIPLRPNPLVRYQYVKPPHRDQWALKLDHSGPIDWSISYFDGNDPTPDLSFASVSATGVDVRLTNHRLRVAGIDASTGVGRYVFRGEAAWVHATDADDADPFAHKRSQSVLVVGGERGFGDHFNVNLQYVVQRVNDFTSPEVLANPLLRQIAFQQTAVANQVASRMDGITLRLAWSWINDTLRAETSTFYLFTNDSYLWRGKLSYAFHDRWRLYLGFDRYRGPDHSLAGALQDNSTKFGELRYVF